MVLEFHYTEIGWNLYQNFWKEKVTLNPSSISHKFSYVPKYYSIIVVSEINSTFFSHVIKFRMQSVINKYVESGNLLFHQRNRKYKLYQLKNYIWFVIIILYL